MQKTALVKRGDKLIIPDPGLIDRGPDGDDDELSEENIQIQYDEARRELVKLSHELLAAEKTGDADRLSLRIQRLRVHMKLLNEAQTGHSDPELHREMKLLRQMLPSEDPNKPGDEGDDADVERMQGAADRLDAEGIDMDRAAKMVRIATALMRKTDGTQPGPRALPDPPASDRT